MFGLKKLLKSFDEVNTLKVLVVTAIVIYILGIAPQLKAETRALFDSPFVKVLALVAIISTGYFDGTVSSLLAIAFVVSYLSSNGTSVTDVILGESKNIVGQVSAGASKVVGGVGSGAGQLIGSIGSGTGELIDNIGEGAQQVLGGLGSGAQDLVGGVSSGTQQLVGGIGSGAQLFLGATQQLVGGIEGASNSVIGGVGSGTQRLIGGAQMGAQQVLRGIEGGTQKLIGGVESGTQRLVSGLQSGTQGLLGSVENFKGCSAKPMMSSGCDPIVGYNASYDTQNACLNKGVEVWQNEMGAQGLKGPRGYAGHQDGAVY